MILRNLNYLAVATMLATILPLVSHAQVVSNAQGIRIGNSLIPESSIERPGDVGVRAHTCLEIYVGPRGGIGFDGGLAPGGGLTPAQLRSTYSLPSTGGSQIIAVVDAYDDPNALSDFNTFSTQFSLPTETSTTATASTNKVFQVLYENGSKPTTDSTGGWELEEALDIEWAHAMAPSAKIILVEAASTSFTDLLSAEATATSYTDGNGLEVKEVTNSWGGSEFSGENFYDSDFASTNVVYFFSAGDNGAPAHYPSASPYVVSVGGTTVNTNSSGVFTSETGWSLSSGSGGGGGPSAYETRPSFQSGTSGIVGSWRGTPDIAYDGNPSTGAAVYNTYAYNGTSYTWWIVGGTSLSSPAMAGIANLSATSAGSFPAGSQTLLTTIYNNLGTANFRDITSGNNGYAAGVGWDFVTGVGSCIGLAGLLGPPTTTLTPSPAPNAAGWNTANVSVTLHAVDTTGGSGVKQISYSLNGGTPTVVSGATATFNVSAEAITSLTYFAKANTGNTEPQHSTSVKIDKTAPVTSAPTVSSNQITLSATDNLSGVASTTYSLDGGANQAYAGPLALDVNLHTLNYFSTDVAGNVETSHFAFICAYPYLFSISPSSTTAGNGMFTLTVTGVNFDNTCYVTWEGANLATTFVNSTTLTATVPAANIASIGSAQVGVTSASNGSAAYPMIFVINALVGKPRLTCTIALSRATGGSNNVVATITLNNVGTANSTNVSINTAKMTNLTTSGSAVNSLTTLPLSVGTVAAGGSKIVTLTFPASVGSTGNSVRLTVVGTESATNFGIDSDKNLP